MQASLLKQHLNAGKMQVREICSFRRELAKKVTLRKYWEYQSHCNMLNMVDSELLFNNDRMWSLILKK